MKKCLILIAFLVPLVAVKSQTIIVDSIVIHCAQVSANDVIYAFPNEQLAESATFQFIFTTTNADDATVSIMVAGVRGAWETLSTPGNLFPLTLNKTTYTNALTSIASKSYFGGPLAYPFQGVLYHKGSVTTGTIIVKRTLVIPVKRTSRFQ